MKGFENITSVYFIGIGGIGMSALARLFNHHRLKVAGYDRTPSDLTRELQSEGIEIHYEDLGDAISAATGPRDQTLVVVTPAVPEDFGEWAWFRTNGFEIWKRSRVLGHICRQYKCLAVAGTHGKTTVSTMATLILSHTAAGCGAVLGGISKNFTSNLLIPVSEDQWIITEADEYDRSFHQLNPDIAVITAMDADHLDIYGHHEAIVASFREYAGKIRPGGKLLVKKTIAGYFDDLEGTAVHTYSLSDDTGFSAAGMRLDEVSRCYRFRLSTPGGLSPEIHMNYPGLLNVENAVAAGASAWLAGAGFDEICAGLEAYKGVRRRFDILYRSENQIFIDDYAHHPEELRAFITSVRALYPGRKITGIFQPHLFSRTRDFADEFAASLDLLDTAVILPVYPARELPIPGISSKILTERMQIHSKFLVEKDGLCAFIRSNPPEILLTMGAGDIELLAGQIIEVLKHEKEN